METTSCLCKDYVGEVVFLYLKNVLAFRVAYAKMDELNRRILAEDILKC